MRKPSNRDKFQTTIDTMVRFYARRDLEMVRDVLAENLAEINKKIQARQRRQEQQGGIHETVC